LLANSVFSVHVNQQEVATGSPTIDGSLDNQASM